MSVNVNRSVLDQFYRYKMPRLIAKVTTSLLVSKIQVKLLYIFKTSEIWIVIMYALNKPN